MNRLAGKRIMVTAAAAGIGKEAVQHFAAQGAAVVHAVDRDTEGLASLTNPAIKTYPTDLLKDDEITQVCNEVGPVDVLFNCAGYVDAGALLEVEAENWDLSFNLNVRSMFLLCQAVLPHMLQQGHGNIINMASVAGVSTGVASRCAYSASKAAVVGLTKSIAVDYVAQNVRCNAVCPGTVDTPSLAERLSAFDDPAQARKDFEDRQPMKRLGRAEEIAQLLIYLASDESSYTTGQVHVIDGGWSNG